MIPHRNDEGLIEWFEHPKPTGKTLVYHFVPNCGLANQIFEICAAYGIARRTGCHLRWTWKPSRLRNFELTHFGFAHTVHEGTPIIFSRAGQGNIKLVREAERRIRATDLPTFAISCPFQDEKCFAEDAQWAEDTFTPEPYDLPLEEGETPVAVQIRRTDYVGHPRLDVVTPAYFDNAMTFIRGRVAKPRFIVESDDPTWCRHRYANREDVTVMNSRSGIEGLRVLASCDHHIISNSTFGWWGAWLAERRNPESIVVTPEIWHHRPGSYGDWKPVPKRWHRVSIKAAHNVNPIPFEDYEVEEPRHERAILVPWHQAASTWQELRYCLRSIDRFFTDRECPIYILGTVRPPWLLYGEQRVEFILVHGYRSALVKGLQMADKVAWFNDDQCLLRECGWAELGVTRYLRKIEPDFLEKAGDQNNAWRAGCLHVLKQLRLMGIDKQFVYSTHVPYVFDREKAVSVFREFGVFDKFPMELAYFHLYPGPRQELVEGFRATDENFGEKTVLHYSDNTLTPALREAIAELLPDYAPWELQAPF